MGCVEVVQTLSDPNRFIFYGTYCGIDTLDDMISMFLQSTTHGPGMHVLRMGQMPMMDAVVKDTPSKPKPAISTTASTTSTSSKSSSSSLRVSTLKCKARIAALIQQGADWDQIVATDPIYVANHFVVILSMYVQKKNTMMPPMSKCAPIDKESIEYMNLNGPSRAMVNLYDLILVQKIRQKGVTVIYIFGETDSYKTSVVRRAIAPIATVRDVQYHAGWYVPYILRILFDSIHFQCVGMRMH
eukprot:227002_1